MTTASPTPSFDPFTPLIAPFSPNSSESSSPDLLQDPPSMSGDMLAQYNELALSSSAFKPASVSLITPTSTFKEGSKKKAKRACETEERNEEDNQEELNVRSEPLSKRQRKSATQIRWRNANQSWMEMLRYEVAHDLRYQHPMTTQVPKRFVRLTQVETLIAAIHTIRSYRKENEALAEKTTMLEEENEACKTWLPAGAFAQPLESYTEPVCIAPQLLEEQDWSYLIPPTTTDPYPFSPPFFA